MALTLDSLTNLAALLPMPASALPALPVAVEAFARKTGMTVDAMLLELKINAPLRGYLAEVCVASTEALAGGN